VIGSPSSRSRSLGLAAGSRAGLLVLAFAACVPGAQSSSSPEPRGCTEIGCQSGFAVDLVRPLPWTAGRYRVEVTGDANASCEVDLPLSCERPARCSGQPGSVTLGLSGCALDASQHSISSVFFPGLPGTVTVTVLQDDRPLGTGTFSPAYRSTQPNGPDCEPICRTAPPATLPLAP
jgi:hypothetical protein